MIDNNQDPKSTRSSNSLPQKAGVIHTSSSSRRPQRNTKKTVDEVGININIFSSIQSLVNVTTVVCNSPVLIFLSAEIPHEILSFDLSA